MPYTSSTNKSSSSPAQTERISSAVRSLGGLILTTRGLSDVAAPEINLQKPPREQEALCSVVSPC